MTPRELALAVVRDVFPRDGRARGAHESFDYRASRSGLDVRDRAFAAELAYGAIRMRRYLDWLLEPYVGKRAEKLPPTIGEILRLGAYQIANMSVEPHAAVGETVGLAKRHGHRGTAGLVNAVLRRLAILDGSQRIPKRDEFASDDDYLGTRFSFPTWIVALVRRVFGTESVEPILGGMNLPARLAVRANLTRATPEEVLEELRARGVSASPSQLVREIIVTDGARAEALSDTQHRWDVQGEIAAMPVDLLDPKPGETGVELCSGRGNKTLQIAGRLGGRGIVESIEIDRVRAAQQRARIDELEISNVVIHEEDALAMGPVPNADFVLVDAPCSGVGILGRQPEARWRKGPGDPDRLAPLQAALLDAGASRVHEGGRLVYSVCSFAPQETEDRVDAFLRGHPSFHVRAQVRVPPGLEQHDGFFIALLERASA